MATNTSALKTFAQETRKKLISLISTKMDFILTQDTAELRGFESQIAKLKSAIATKGKELVVEEVAYTWFNRVMALRYMDANGYTDLKVVTPGMGQMRPEILQEAMAGNIDEDLHVKVDDNPKEAVLYRRLLVAVCNQYGTTMPFLFEHICDYTEMLLPDDLLSDQSFVTDIRNGMTNEDCLNVEIMGWLYQFYITDRKADAETKKTKKGGLKSDEQAAATQLFTPHWVVRYMVENSLGRIWMTLHPESELKKEMPYYIATPEGQTEPIPDNIHSVTDISFIDTCCGSGHVLVYAFDLFSKMYEEEGFQSKEIPALIIQNNIFGIDIDRRCYQLASFALTMKGRAYHSRYLRKPVQPNVIALQNIDRDTLERAGSWNAKSTMWQFENVDTIGSLLQISPKDWAAIQIEEGLFGENQKVLKTQAEYLSRKYSCVVTNPPYLGKGFGDALKNYILAHYPNSKLDTMATFMERCLDFCAYNGKMSMINQQTWMFISSYETLRENLLKNYQIDTLLHLGPHAFDEIPGEKVQCATFTMANRKPTSNGIYFNLVEGEDCGSKESLFLSRATQFNNVNQKDFSKIPGGTFGYWGAPCIIDLFKNPLLYSVSQPRLGMATADNNKFLRFYWEVSRESVLLSCNSTEESTESSCRWYPYAKGGSARKWYGNMDTVVNWFNNGEDIQNFTDEKGKVRSHNYNLDFIFKKGITWNALSSNPTFRVIENALFDNAGSSLFANHSNDYYCLLGMLNTKIISKVIPLINPTLNSQPGTIGSLPSLVADVDNIVENNISISRYDWDSHETSWDFRRNPLFEQQLKIYLDEVANSMSNLTIEDIESVHMPELQQPLEVLMENYCSEWEDLFDKLHKNEEELNRKFIKNYGLQDEISSDIPLEEITILQKGEISISNNKIIWNKDVIIKQFISWMVGCFMGRYSVDKSGLIIASQGQKVEDLDLPVHTLEIDDDGIIPVIQEEDFFDDDMTQRIETAIKILFGEQNFHANMKFIKECLGQELRDYLYKDFYTDHIDGKMYQKRPIYWLFSSKMGDKKKKGYFKALVYMHRIESDTLSKLHADYVSPYLDKIEQQKQEAEDDAVRDDLSQAQRNKANKLAAELADKVREVKEFATILAQMSTQRLTIDLDDGVKTNYPKYYPLVEPIKGLESKDE